MTAVRLVLWPAGVALGLAAEWVAYGFGAPLDWAPDLATGWTLLACGLVAWSRRPSSECGVLLVATGILWFLPNFETAGAAWLAWVAGHALYLHRGPLVPLLVTHPGRRPRGRLEAVAVATGYAAAVVPGIWEREGVSIVLAAALATVVVYRGQRAWGRERRERGVAALAAAAFSVVVALAAVVRLAVPDVPQERTLLAYEFTLIGIAVAFVLSVLREPAEAAVTDLVVELSETRSGTHRDALARALGDPSLGLGYWLDEEQTYVDGEGRRVALPDGDGAHAVTRIDRDGERVAVLVHDPAVLDEPSLVEAVRTSARLASANARLNAEVREQAAAVEASRLRLLRARDEERRRLDLSLREGAERRLQALRPVLESARRRSGPETAARVDVATERLEATLADLRELAAGLHPRELSERGLEQALSGLAGRCPVPVHVRLSLEPLPFEVENAIYFACSEALANVAKYASATVVELEASVRDDAVRVDVRDDGIGGADPAAGTGLAGLADRLSALGGTLRVDSPAGSGTRIRAEIPLGVSV